MKALLPAPVEARTTPSVLMDGAQASRFDLKPVGCTKENGTPLARTAASPRLCHAPMASPCCTPINDSLTICFTRAARAAFAAASSSPGIFGPLFTRKNPSTPSSAVLRNSASQDRLRARPRNSQSGTRPCARGVPAVDERSAPQQDPGLSATHPQSRRVRVAHNPPGIGWQPP
jgi:hypothetical protein